VNFYFDHLPELVRWFHCRIEFSGKDPTAVYWFDCPAEVPPPLQRILESHYAKLNLANRFREKSAQAIAETLALRGRLKAETYASEFVLKSTRWAELYGVNYWECSLLSAMSDSCFALM
jgi:hypothetical protein